MRDLFLLRPDIVHLNHGAFGACPRPVFEAYHRWQLELEQDPVDFLDRRFKPLMAEARAVLAAYLGADLDDVVYVTNATTGLNLVARALDLRPGDEVLTTDHEYGAIVKTWEFICARRGALLVQAPVPVPVSTAGDVEEAVWAHVSPRTRVLSLSHLTSPTALIFPVAELVARAREAGIFTIVDGAHAPGQIPLDLRALGADVYVGNCHKWMCAPKGAGFLHVRREVQPLLAPLVVSWGWPGGFVDTHEWQGTRDPAAFLAVPAALQFMAAHDWPAVQARCRALTRDARAALLDLTGLPPLSPDGPEWFAQMVSVPVPVDDARGARARLFEEFRIEVPVIDWNGRALLRVSTQAYNTPADVDALLAAVRRLLS